MSYTHIAIQPKYKKMYRLNRGIRERAINSGYRRDNI